MSATTTLTFIRHGETDWNWQKRFQGQIDVPLNAAGRAQAERLAARLAARPAQRFFSSDLARARETAAPLGRAWQMAPLPRAAFREQSFGVLEGLDVPTIRERYPDLWARWLEHAADFALPGGESLRQFHGRVIAALRELVAAHPGEHLAIVTHGGVLDMLWRTAHGLPLAGLRQCEIPNAAINRLRWQGSTLSIDHWADTAHLAGLPEQPGTEPGER